MFIFASRNEDAGSGEESDASGASSPASRPSRAFEEGSFPATAAAPVPAASGSPAAAAAGPPSTTGGEGEEGQKQSRGAKTKSKPQSASCSTWASVAAGGAKPSAAASVAVASASLPVALGPQGKVQQTPSSTPGVFTSLTAHKEQRQKDRQLEQQDEASATEGDAEPESEPKPEQATRDTKAEDEQSPVEGERPEQHPAEAAAVESTPVCAVGSEAPLKEKESMVEASASPADASDNGMARQQQQQQQHQRQHEQQEPPQQPPSWPCFHPTFQQRPLGTSLVAPGLQGPLLDTVTASVPSSSAAAAEAAPQQIQSLPPAQQQRPIVTRMEMSSLSEAGQIMHQLQQQQHQALRPCASDRMLQEVEDQGESGGGRYGPPPGLEGFGGPGNNRTCRARSHSSSSSSRLGLGNSIFAPSASILEQQGGTNTVGGLHFAAEPTMHSGVGANNSSRFAFASNADGDDEPLFEIPGVEDCLLWLANPNAQSAAAAAAEETAAQQHHGHVIRNAERQPLVDTNAGAGSLQLPLANSWAPQRHNKDFVFGPGVGGASLPSLQQQQRQQSERWRQLGQHPAAPGSQPKAVSGVAGIAASAFERSDAYNSRRGGWVGNERLSGHDQQLQQQQHEQLQQLLRQQQQLIVQQQQQQARSRGTAALPVPLEQQQQQQQVLAQQQLQQLALLQQLLPAACALGRSGSVPPADTEEALKLLLCLIPNPAGQTQRLPPSQQQQSQLRYVDGNDPTFSLGSSGNRDAETIARMRALRMGGALSGGQVGASGASGALGADETGDGCWSAGGGAATSESGRGRSAARRGSVPSLDATDRGPAFPGCVSFPHFDSRPSEHLPCSAGTSLRGGASAGGSTDAGSVSAVCNAPSNSGNELLPFLQRQRMQQFQQQQLQQLQRALESQRLE